MPIPKEIKDLKPTCFGAVEIRKFGESYYVYQISSVYDKKKQRPRKVTGKSMGKITIARGFVPNANGMREMQKAGTLPKTQPVVKNYGAYETLRQISPEIQQYLHEVFPDYDYEISTLALLRLVDGISNQKMVSQAFLSCYLSDRSAEIATSETSIRKLITELGTRDAEIEVFMRKWINPGASLLFDGTTIFTKGNISLAQKGYNPEHKQDTQARLLYVFERESQRPVFYRVLQGSIVDKAAFIDTITLSGTKNCIVIADKGFYSKKNTSALMASNLRYLLPLQSNTALVPESFYENPDNKKFGGAFVYHDRLIWFKKEAIGKEGNFVYTFRDDGRCDNQRVSAAKRIATEKNCSVLSPEDLMNNNKCGYFSFLSNIDTESKEIYLLYKERWDIEQCFDYLKNSVSNPTSYAQTDEYFKGWAFLNHISLLYYYGLLNRIREKKLDEKYSVDDVLKLTKNIFIVTYGDLGEKQISAIQTKTEELLKKLGVDLLRET